MSPAQSAPLSALHLLDDAGLAHRASDGERRAFQVLVERHQGALRTWLRRSAPRPDLAEDVAQEAFLKAWRNLARWDRRGSFRSWLFGIACHAAADARRTNQRDLERDSRWVAETAPANPGPAAAREAAIDVDRILAALAPAQRQVVAMCYGAGFSHQEAADALGLPLGTVKSHVARGREQALAILQAPGGGHHPVRKCA